MKIVNIRVLRGPNFWSIRRTKLIQMTLALEELEDLPTNKIEGFREKLQSMLPGLYEHRCSEGVPGGFLNRVDEGTWMGHVIEHIALELQTLAGMDMGFGRTRGTGKHGEYFVVFDYMEEDAGVYAARSAVRLVEHLLGYNPDYNLETELQAMREIREDTRLGPSTGAIVEEAIRRGIPFIRLNKHSLVQLGYGVFQKRIRATIASTTSCIAVDIAGDKDETKNLLSKAEIPVPNGILLGRNEPVEDAIRAVGYPMVIKPLDGNHGKGATTNITNKEQAIVALEAARQYGRTVICEKFIKGFDFRILVINYKFICAALRTPASVTGDGVHTIRELVDEANKDPRRGFGHEKVLTQITVDGFTMKMLDDAGLTLESIPEKGQLVILKPTANLSTGGTSEDVTDQVHPVNIFLAERIARIIGLDICGIDVMATDLKTPLRDSGGAVLEVNAAPGFRMHIEPAIGIPRNVAEPVVNMLFPSGHGRIPIIAITGTNGKTTTSRLTAHIVKSSGYKVGFTTSDGVYIQNQMMMTGDCTGPRSAEFVLKDPTVDFAVLECARGGILKNGLAFQTCDIAIVTNISADHIGLGGIDTLEQMARVKGVVPETVTRNGYAILNADDELVYNLKKELQCNVALFSMDEKNKRVQQHCKRGGIAAVYENEYITIMKGMWKIRVERVVDIPLTFGGKAVHNIMNTLPSVLAAYLAKIDLETIKEAVKTFIPSPVQTPGRLNIFEFKNFKFLVDFAHNPAGLDLLCDFVNKLESTKKVGIISGTGDRRDEDIREIGRISAANFDEIIIRQDKNLRGRSAEEIVNLLVEGIDEAKTADIPVHIIQNEQEAILFAYKNAYPGSLITIMCDVVPDALEFIKHLKEEEDKELVS